MFIAIFAVSLAFAIALHELGHFATAKAFGMKVEKFFIGFGPTLWSVRRGETEYGVKGIPAGGFVKIIGMNQLEEVDPADEGRAFRDKSAWKRVIVLSAGSATHFVLAFLLLFSALAFIGLQEATNTVNVVVEGSPAQQAGLRVGDEIVALDGEPVDEFTDISANLRGRPGEAVEVTYERDGARRNTTATLGSKLPDGTPGAFLGVGPQFVRNKMSVGDAAYGAAIGEFSVPRITGLTLVGLGDAFRPSQLLGWLQSIDDEERPAEGPQSLVGVGRVVNDLGRSGEIFLLLLVLAQLNIVLGTLNMLPLPPLDGGHVAVLLVEEGVNRFRRMRGRATGWHLDPAVVTPIAVVVILFFVALSVTALYADIVNPIVDPFAQ